MLKFYLETDYPVALDSYDYLYPLGAIKDNNRNRQFNQKLYRFPGAVLDLGCAGGGFVKNCLDDQRLAMGLEGNDYNQKVKRAEWATVPDYLFTCDITKPFTVHIGDKVLYRFGIVTAWDVLEHILKADLPQLFTNIHRHLIPDGLLIVSISDVPSLNHRYPNIDMHRTLEGLDWWVKQMVVNNLVRDEGVERYFDKDWVRIGSFNLVFRKK